MRLFPVHDGKHCGYSDSSGKVVIPPQFLNCEAFSEGLAAIQMEDGWGYIDEKGTAEIAPRFAAAERFSDGLAFVTNSDRSQAVIDRHGKVLFRADYYEHGAFSEGLAPVHMVRTWICPGEKLEIRESCPDGKGFPRDAPWGYIDTTGAMAIAPRLRGASEFHEGLAYADGGFIDRQGNNVIPGPFWSATAFANGVAAVQVYHQPWGYINKQGAWLVFPKYDEAHAIEEGRGLVKLNGQYGYVDTSGTEVIAPQFENALAFSEGRAAVRKDGRWGYIDPAGSVVIPFQFEAAERFQDGFATVVMESRPAVIDRRGVPVKTEPATLAQTFRRLQGFEVKPHSMAPLAQILPIFSVYKEQLRELAVESLKEADDPAELKTAIETKLNQMGIHRAKEEESRPYGLIDNLEIDQPPLQPGLISVLYHLRLVDAVDTSLSIFRRRGMNWDLVYKLDRNDYFKWELDAYHVAPPQFTASDSKGSAVMLLASDSGRSGNGGYGLWVDLYRVDVAFRPEPIFHTTFHGKDHQIALDAGGFRLETISMEDDTSRGGYRVFPYRYEIHGDRVTRVAPIGFDAHDFVGEWGNLPWEEAAKWSDPAHLDHIQEFYHKLRSPDGHLFGEFGPIQVCDPEQRIWQVGYNTFHPDRDHAAAYFIVERKDKWTFVVKDIGKQERGDCKPVVWEPGQPFQTMFAKPLQW